MIIVINK